MFGVGPWEMAFCAVIVLLVYGPDRLPQIARKVGRFVREFRQISDAVTMSIRREMNQLEHLAEEQEKQKAKIESPENKIVTVEEKKEEDVPESVSRDS